MTSCYHCGDEIFGEPFFCSECGQQYCPLHKDPVNHDCNIIKGAVNPYQQPTYLSSTPTYVSIPRQAPSLQERINRQQMAPGELEGESTLSHGYSSSQIRGTTDGSFTWHRQEKFVPENAFDPDSGIHFKGILLPHKSELMHLLIGAILIFCIGLISFYNQSLINQGLAWAIPMLAAFYTTAFLFHEFGHRQVAKHYKLQTKFRLLTFGMIITFVGLIGGIYSIMTGALSFPSLALPGAVVVLGLDKVERRTGLCKAAGPIVNLIYGITLLTVSFTIDKSTYPLNMFIGLAAYINFMLGTFNMIPIGILDGQNILKWNKGLYIILMTTLLLCLIITLANVYAPCSVSLYIPDSLKPYCPS